MAKPMTFCSSTSKQTILLLSRAHLALCLIATLGFVFVKWRTELQSFKGFPNFTSPLIFKCPSLSSSSGVSQLTPAPSSPHWPLFPTLLRDIRSIAYLQSAVAGAVLTQRLASTIDQTAFVAGEPAVKHLPAHHHASLMSDANEPDRHCSLSLAWSSQTPGQKLILGSHICSLPLPHSLSLLRRELHIFQSALHKILVSSLFYLSAPTENMQSFNGYSFEVSLKTILFLHSPCQTSSFHTWVYSRDSQLSFLFLLLSLQSYTWQQNFLTSHLYPVKTFMAPAALWSYFMSNIPCLVCKAPVNLALC